MIVRGEDVLVYEYIDGFGWVLYACARSVSLSLATEMIETSVSGAAGWYTGEPAQHSFTGTLSGLVNLDDPTKISLPDLRTKQINRTKLKLKFHRTANGIASVYIEEGFFYITNTTDEGSLNQVNTFSVELQGTGALTQI